MFYRFSGGNERAAFLHNINELVEFALNVPLELFYAYTRVVNNRFYERSLGFGVSVTVCTMLGGQFLLQTAILLSYFGMSPEVIPEQYVPFPEIASSFNHVQMKMLIRNVRRPPMEKSSFWN